MSPRPLDAADEIQNLPTPEGQRVGAELGKLADAAEAEQREAFPDQVPRCNDCAYRTGTPPNGCLETVMDAIKCVVECKPFYCHKGLKDGDPPKRLCSGAMLLYDGPQGDLLREAIRKQAAERAAPVVLRRRRGGLIGAS